MLWALSLIVGHDRDSIGAHQRFIGGYQRQSEDPKLPWSKTMV